MPNQEIGQPNGSMPGQGGMNTNITYSASKEITEDTTIENEKDSSEKADENSLLINGDIDVNASNIEVTKTGDSDGGTYKTTGQGTPTIYSTADITVKNADLIAETSEEAIIEGKNSILLDNVNLTDTNNKLNGQSTTYKNIFIYQSMSGDALERNSNIYCK